MNLSPGLVWRYHPCTAGCGSWQSTQPSPSAEKGTGKKEIWLKLEKVTQNMCNQNLITKIPKSEVGYSTWGWFDVRFKLKKYFRIFFLTKLNNKSNDKLLKFSNS